MWKDSLRVELRGKIHNKGMIQEVAHSLGRISSFADVLKRRL